MHNISPKASTSDIIYEVKLLFAKLLVTSDDFYYTIINILDTDLAKMGRVSKSEFHIGIQRSSSYIEMNINKLNNYDTAKNITEIVTRMLTNIYFCILYEKREDLVKIDSTIMNKLSLLNDEQIRYIISSGLFKVFIMETDQKHVILRVLFAD